MKSIKTKILVMIGGVAILAMIISGGISIKNTLNMVDDSQETISTLTTDKLGVEINEYFTKYKTMAIQMAGNTSVRQVLTEATRENYKDKSSFKDTYKYLGFVAEKDEQISTAYVCSAKDTLAFDGTSWVSDKDYDLKSKKYWFSNEEDIKNGYIITDPFEDVISGNMIVSFAAPVYSLDGKEIVGVAALDIQLDTLSNKIASTETVFGKDAYTMLVSRSGQVLASKDNDKLLKNVSQIGFDETMLKEVENPSKKVIEYTENGQTRYGIVNATRDAGLKTIFSISEDRYNALVKKEKKYMMLVYGLAIIILLVVIYFVTKSIVSPIQKLMEVTEDLAEGNLDAEIDIDNNDETGKLAESMKKLVTRLNEYIVYIDEIAESLNRFSTGDLNIDLKQDYDGEFEKIKDSLIQLSEIFKHTIGQIIETSENVALGSREIATASQVLADGALYQANTTEELTSTVNDLSDRVSKNAENALGAADQIKSVGELSNLSNDQMQKMMEAITEINNKSSEIGKVIKVIEDIAFQTNILALNAAVEASRAGEAGKGFAVVADEVRNLATKSADAAKETTHLIEESIKAVENGNKIANKTGEMLVEVLQGVSESVKLIDEISDESSEQATALKQTLEGIEEISNVVQTNVSTSEESSAASNDLSKQAEDLRAIASQFKIDDETN
ncbi:MAG: methyl-accepting chemotaxis protein [Terrisporobacter othiniensis]|uniref:methyl-accepting chemotaxis protein n=1 Tax=Terrisporobacter petrolearius TaxID=1460447 RepID=UPI0022E1E17B|nr:methyl-accepting chemotaxis protein [Terrisporobacter petrolearius]MDU4860096.1 methyl-accepting chemotaxis protein [Terrisporobacter othiniensis]MDU6994314.1 methyl-accepting chemotaxis protein [Terrisporobacter othiniensis]